MLFNSYPFLFIFLPIILVATWGLCSFRQRTAAKYALFVGSLVFYAWWTPQYLPLLLVLIGLNYAVGRYLLRTVGEDSAAKTRAWVAGLAITANVALLVYYKYTNFALGLWGVKSNILLPLGLSFITFQKIAFLVDVYSGTVTQFSFIDYCLFASFFPQLISGPIVHHREVIPQFEDEETLRFSPLNVATGATLFVIGLLKKVLLADRIAPVATAVFTAASHGTALPMMKAWSGALAYTFQLYFDFSGYCDMALGLAMLFGIRLPVNFDSPLRATSIIDFWQRWHITLTRFLTAYIYNPLTLWISRARAVRGLPLMTRKKTTPGAFAALVAFPTLLTMGIAGIWHGAGFQFLVFGLLHGVYLVVNHAWLAIRRMGGRKVDAGNGRSYLRMVATLVCVAVALVFFRADSVRSGLRVIRAMVGFGGASGRMLSGASGTEYGLIGAMLVIAWWLPNSQQLLGHFLAKRGGMPPEVRDPEAVPAKLRIQWSPTVTWGLACGALAAYLLTQLSNTTEFLYFNF